MNPMWLLIVAMAGMVLVIFIFAAIWASRYFRVGPNQVLIVSGRQHQLADGTRRGFRIVRTGGTFVIPVTEKAEALSLEVQSIEMPKQRVPTTQAPITMDCLAEAIIKGDDAAILMAAEHFLSKSETEVKKLIQAVLEKHLGAVPGRMGTQEIERDPAGCAAKVEAAAAPDLDRMGLSVVSFRPRLQPFSHDHCSWAGVVLASLHEQSRADRSRVAEPLARRPETGPRLAG